MLIEAFFAVLLHAVIVLGLGVYFLVIFKAILVTGGEVERLIRGTAFASGLLVFFASKIMGISIADFLVDAVRYYNPFFFVPIAGLLPAGLGTLLAWYCIRSLNRSTNVAIRLMIVIGALSLIQFGDVYVKATRAEGLALDRAFVPNLAFTLAISLYVILRYDPGVDDSHKAVRESEDPPTQAA